MMTPPETLLSTADLARRWGLKVQTLECWRSLRRPHPHYIKIGGAVRYRYSDVLAFEAARTVAPGEAEPAEPAC